MKDSTRAHAAAVVGAAFLHKNINAIYDYSTSSYRNISVRFSSGVISGYDYSTSSHFSGSGIGALDFYDYNTSKHVNLKLSGTHFNGYDYDTQKHFTGTINGASISLYDYETSKFYNYTI